jgi:probable rRNA maturation factor
VTIEVEISDTQLHLKVDRSSIRALVRTVLLAEERESATISIALVDNATIHAVNRAYLNHDWPTDVISFALSDPGDPDLAGELVVSTEMAHSCALERNIELLDELALYVVHGLLHLCGYDDKTVADACIMRHREHEVLSEAGVRNPFPLVSQARTALAHAAGSIPQQTEPQPWAG